MENYTAFAYSGRGRAEVTIVDDEPCFTLPKESFSPLFKRFTFSGLSIYSYSMDASKSQDVITYQLKEGDQIELKEGECIKYRQSFKNVEFISDKTKTSMSQLPSLQLNFPYRLTLSVSSNYFFDPITRYFDSFCITQWKGQKRIVSLNKHGCNKIDENGNEIQEIIDK